MNLSKLIKNIIHKKTFPNFLSVAAIVKNEAPYLREWIEYHKSVGVEKFYIYDNESTDNIREVLAPYINGGGVEYIFFPGKMVQIKVYEDAFKRFKNKTKWMAIIDLDEFIVPLAYKNITDFLCKTPESASQILLGWTIYGSAGHKTKPAGLVIENYKRREKEPGHPFFKSIVNPRDVIAANVHFSKVAGDTIDENGLILNEHENYIRQGSFPITIKPLTKDKIRINHYIIKSQEEYRQKSARGSTFNSDYNYDFFKANDRNDVLDTVMDKYIIPVKESIKQINN